MPVNVDQVTSEVVAESGAPTAPSGGSGGGSGSGQESPWLSLARHRDLGAQAAEDALRTRAEAYDD